MPFKSEDILRIQQEKGKKGYYHCIRILLFTEENCNNDMPNKDASIPIIIMLVISEKSMSV
jgi:hypothetical protein